MHHKDRFETQDISGESSLWMEQMLPASASTIAHGHEQHSIHQNRSPNVHIFRKHSLQQNFDVQRCQSEIESNRITVDQPFFQTRRHSTVSHEALRASLHVGADNDHPVDVETVPRFHHSEFPVYDHEFSDTFLSSPKSIETIMYSSANDSACNFPIQSTHFESLDGRYQQNTQRDFTVPRRHSGGSQVQPRLPIRNRFNSDGYEPYVSNEWSSYEKFTPIHQQNQCYVQPQTCAASGYLQPQGRTNQMPVNTYI